MTKLRQKSNDELLEIEQNKKEFTHGTSSRMFTKGDMYWMKNYTTRCVIMNRHMPARSNLKRRIENATEEWERNLYTLSLSELIALEA